MKKMRTAPVGERWTAGCPWRGRGLLAVGVVAVGAAMAGGCASEQAVTSVEAPAPARWEAVWLPAETAAGVGECGDNWAWWETRRDSALAVRSPGPLLATDQWPEPARPSMDEVRYISVPSRPETIMYFRPERAW